MIGPVLYQELLLAGRRSQQHVFRWIYAGWLVLQVTWFCYFGLLLRVRSGGFSAGDLAHWFVELYIVQQLILMVLAVPALAAGSITEEKANGTLQYLLTSDLTPRHIITGKLLARAFQVAVLTLTGLPLLGFLGALAGLEPIALLAVLVVPLGPLLALVSASLLASVWSTQTRNAAIGLYAVGAAGALAVGWLGDALLVLDPLYVLEPAWGGRDREAIRTLAGRVLGSLAAWGGIAGACLVLAAWRLRPAYLRQLESAGRKRARWWRPERAPVGDEPIGWKEQHVEGLAPAAFLRRLPRWLGVLAVFAAATASSTLHVWEKLNPGATLGDLFASILRLDLGRLAGMLRPPTDAFQGQGVIVMLLASLLVGIRCSGAVSGERERQTWEALLLTPLSVRQVIRGKLWGVMGASYVYLLAYAVPALALALVGSVPELVQFRFPEPLFWTVVLLAATVLAMYCIGVVGIWCSVRCRTSWRSLLWTVGIGYVGGFLVYWVTAFPLAILALLIFFVLLALGNALGISAPPSLTAGCGLYYTIFKITSCLGLAGIAWLLSRYLLSSAQQYVAFRERTAQWEVEPVPRRLPRYPAPRVQ